MKLETWNLINANTFIRLGSRNLISPVSQTLFIRPCCGVFLSKTCLSLKVNSTSISLQTYGQKKRFIETLRYLYYASIKYDALMHFMIITEVHVYDFLSSNFIERNSFRQMHALSHDLHVQQFKRNPHVNYCNFKCILNA